MQETLALAQKLRKDSPLEVPVAAIIVKDSQIIGIGLNNREATHSVLGHAEIMAIEAASQKISNWNLSGCTIYVSLEPCAMCAGAIIQSHISEVVFAAYDAKSGAFGSRHQLKTANMNVSGGILEEQAVSILQEFFSHLRS